MLEPLIYSRSLRSRATLRWSWLASTRARLAKLSGESPRLARNASSVWASRTLRQDARRRLIVDGSTPKRAAICAAPEVIDELQAQEVVLFIVQQRE